MEKGEKKTVLRAQRNVKPNVGVLLMSPLHIGLFQHKKNLELPTGCRVGEKFLTPTRGELRFTARAFHGCSLPVSLIAPFESFFASRFSFVLAVSPR